MRLVYTADLHGDVAAFRALLDLAVASGARAAIVGGDLLPHAIRLADAIQNQRAFIDAQLRPLLSTFRAQHPSISVFLLAGNDDWAAAIAALADLEQEELAYPLHQRVYQLPTTDHRQRTTEPDIVGGRWSVVGANLWLAGYACVPLTPFSIKDYERRDEGALPPFSYGMAYTSWNGSIESFDPAAQAGQPSIADDLERLAQRSDPGRTIYVCHTPPVNTALDQMPRGRHVGSQALRAFIERRQPLLTLHGHIHEAPDESGRYAIRLGDTWCVNPGHTAGRFQAVALDTDDIERTITHTIFGRPTTTR